MIATLARLVHPRDRDALAAELITALPDPQPADASAPGDSDTGDTVCWDELWARVLPAQVFLEHAAALLADERLPVDLRPLSRAVHEQADAVGEVYALSCDAQHIPNLPVPPGTDLDTLRSLVDTHRARVVDAELAAAHTAPPATGPRWLITYGEHGGFLATTAGTSRTEAARRLAGWAPTAYAAQVTVAQYHAPAPVTTVLDPPPTGPARWVPFRASRMEHYPDQPTVEDLLDTRGQPFQDFVAACKEAQTLLRRGNIAEQLRERAGILNRDRAQLADNTALRDPGEGANRHHGGFATSAGWVPTHLVVSTGHRTWGEFGDHRPEVPLEIARALAETGDLNAFATRFLQDPISLEHIPAWAGPVYTVSMNGNHRVHTAALLQLPHLAATLRFSARPPAWEVLTLLDEHRLHRSPTARIAEHVRLLEGLLRRGVIDGDIITPAPGRWPHLRCDRLPAPWLLRSPALATDANRVYERCYPGALGQLGIPVNVATDAHRWAHWLHSA